MAFSKEDLEVRQMTRHLNDGNNPLILIYGPDKTCNMIYKDDVFRSIRDKDRSFAKKQGQYELFRQENLRYQQSIK